MTANDQSHSSDEQPTASDVSWPMIGRVMIKAAILFVALNLTFAACRPLDSLASLSLYNGLFPGRLRLPYGEAPAKDNNLTLNNLRAMVAAHAWDRDSADDVFRVLLIGDSGTWGWFLENENTLAGQLNTLDLTSGDGRRLVVYNLGYPVMSLTKDLMLLDVAIDRADPDLILWPVTLQSFARGRQLDHPLIQENAQLVRDLIDRYALSLDPDDERLIDRTFWQETLVGRRRDLADLLRLQSLGLAWAATGRDQDIPDEIPQRRSDLDADESWLDIAGPRPLTPNDLAFDVLAAGIRRAGDIPVVIVNEPIYVSDGLNSDIRYNTFYPRWAYDQYRELMREAGERSGWTYFDLWDAIPPEEFTDTPVHLTPAGTKLLADRVAEALGQFSGD